MLTQYELDQQRRDRAKHPRSARESTSARQLTALCEQVRATCRFIEREAIRLGVQAIADEAYALGCAAGAVETLDDGPPILHGLARVYPRPAGERD